MMDFGQKAQKYVWVEARSDIQILSSEHGITPDLECRKCGRVEKIRGVFTGRKLLNLLVCEWIPDRRA